MMIVDWSQYKFIIENVTEADGGGYRMYAPTLGFAVYGVGDTLSEVLASLSDSKSSFEAFVEANPEYKIPQPCLNEFDVAEPRAVLDHAAYCSNNYSYAA